MPVVPGEQLKKKYTDGFTNAQSPYPTLPHLFTQLLVFLVKFLFSLFVLFFINTFVIVNVNRYIHLYEHLQSKVCG